MLSSLPTRWSFAFLLSLPALGAQESRPVPPMTDEQLLATCDEVMKEVEELRGWKFKTPVKKGVYTEAELRKYLEKKIFEEEYGGGKLERSQALLRVVGLIPADCDVKKTFLDVLLNQVGGFYDPPTRTFYMLKREGVAYPELLNRTLIAHELTHALDDQYVDLDKLMKSRERTEDWGLAISSVAEGSAMALMSIYMVKAPKDADGGAMEQLRAVEKQERERGKILMEVPPYFVTMVAAYTCGMSFLLEGNLAKLGSAKGAAGENVLRAMRTPPASMEQILHPDKYWKEDQRDEPVVFDDASIEAFVAKDGLHVVHKDTLGEVLCALLTRPKTWKIEFERMAASAFWTNTEARGWGGDRFFLLAPGANAATARLEDARGVWVTAWDSKKDRDEFVEGLARRSMPGRTVANVGDLGLLVCFGLQATRATELAEQVLARAKAQRGTRRWTFVAD